MNKYDYSSLDGGSGINKHFVQKPHSDCSKCTGLRGLASVITVTSDTVVLVRVALTLFADFYAFNKCKKDHIIELKDHSKYKKIRR